MTGLEYLLRKQSKFILIFTLFSSSFIYSEAIVNVEDLSRDGEKGFFANVSGSLSFSRGNRNRDSFSIQSSLDYNLEDLETFFVVKRSQKQINQKNSKRRAISGYLYAFNRYLSQNQSICTKTWGL